MVVMDDNDHERGIVLTEEQKRRRHDRSLWRASCCYSSRCSTPGPNLALPLLDALRASADLLRMRSRVTEMATASHSQTIRTSQTSGTQNLKRRRMALLIAVGLGALVKPAASMLERKTPNACVRLFSRRHFRAVEAHGAVRTTLGRPPAYHGFAEGDLPLSVSR